MGRKTVSFLVLILSLALFLSYHVYYWCLEDESNQVASNFLEEDYLMNKVEEKEEIIDEIWGVLEIPKISFKKAFYPLNSKKNLINTGLEVLKNSKMPHITNSSFYIAAHSGNSYLGYFKNLYQLSINDQIMLYFNQQKYSYLVSKIFLQDKIGEISVDKKINDTILVLTTCAKEKDKQLVVIAKLIK